MTLLLFLPLMIATSLPDGGDVPIAIPELTPAVAPILAPELAGATAVPITLSVYRVDAPAELTLTAGAVGLALIVDFAVKPSLEGDISCRTTLGNGRCDSADLSAFDRYSVGKVSRPWGMFSDIAMYASVVLPTLYLGLESLALPTADPWGDWARDLLVISEAMALTAVTQSFLKFAFRRPRPVRYGDVTLGSSTFDQELSFPSGHTSMVAAATTALTVTVFLRHPESKVRFVILGAGILLTSLTGIARIESGHHFPTDVIIGAALGGFAGFVVPWFHKHRSPVIPIAGFDPSRGSSMFGLAGSF